VNGEVAVYHGEARLALNMIHIGLVGSVADHVLGSKFLVDLREDFLDRLLPSSRCRQIDEKDVGLFAYPIKHDTRGGQGKSFDVAFFDWPAGDRNSPQVDLRVHNARGQAGRPRWQQWRCIDPNPNCDARSRIVGPQPRSAAGDDRWGCGFIRTCAGLYWVISNERDRSADWAAGLPPTDGAGGGRNQQHCIYRRPMKDCRNPGLEGRSRILLGESCAGFFMAPRFVGSYKKAAIPPKSP
jgi:hypothetical protein